MGMQASESGEREAGQCTSPPLRMLPLALLGTSLGHVDPRAWGGEASGGSPALCHTPSPPIPSPPLSAAPGWEWRRLGALGTPSPLRMLSVGMLGTPLGFAPPGAGGGGGEASGGSPALCADSLPSHPSLPPSPCPGWEWPRPTSVRCLWAFLGPIDGAMPTPGRGGGEASGG
jgi:hypothetical protein